ncbi:MAG: M43 family zinc metalloprotease [Chitinophagales bacterium]|nr:M43 family zinc metalloprotease [Chitinophagales bacterium]MDW8394320.1 M43 family zinc metalloprotease [Chitinophagales bacterium]
MRLRIALVIIPLLAGSTHAQPPVRQCGTMEVDRQLRLTDPEYAKNRESIELFTQKWIQENPAGLRNVVTIPVVFHVVYNTTAENISDAQLMSQLDVLNEDFRRLNPDAGSTRAGFAAVAADCEIEFCLAQRDPNGNPTNGIVRVYTTKTSFNSNNDVKKSATGGSDAWDRNSYLNIWVCDLTGGLLGYAQFPGGPAATDGIVIDYAYTGRGGSALPPYHLGRTATHEVGHWLNVFHIWGDDGNSCGGSDLVSDTPNQADETYGCPLPAARISCSNGPDGDQYENYMDYTDDACMNLFTLGQKARMQAVLAPGGARASLLSSLGCLPPSGFSCLAPSTFSASSITASSAVISWSAVTGATSYQLQYEVAGSGNWQSITTGAVSYTLTGLTAATTYNYRLQTTCDTAISSWSATASFTTLSGNCTDPYENNNSKNSPASIATGVDHKALISPSGDVDWYSFSNTSSAKNIQVQLTSLPADYDVRLYGPSGSLVASSLIRGTGNETINYNTGVVGTYKIKVNGFNGAHNAVSCYTLRVNLSSSPFRGELPVPFSAAELVIVPNPANEFITVWSEWTEETTVELRIWDMLGREVLTMSVPAQEGPNRWQIATHELPAGRYLADLRSSRSHAHAVFWIVR